MQHGRARGRRDGMSIAERETATSTTLELIVVEGQGVPRGVAYLGPAAFEALSCSPGDVVRIQGSRATVARALPWPGLPAAREGAPPSAGPSPAQPQRGTRDETSQGPGDRALPDDPDRTIQMDGLVRQNTGAGLGELV